MKRQSDIALFPFGAGGLVLSVLFFLTFLRVAENS